MMRLKCHYQLIASSSSSSSAFIIVVIILTQLHLITSAPTSTASAPADDVTDRVTSPWQQSSDATERRQSVLSNEETTQGVRSNAAAASATVNRLRRELYASQGCGPVCNRCRQVRLSPAIIPQSDGNYYHRLCVCMSVCP